MRKPGSKVEGFGGGMLGAAFINVENPDNEMITVPQNLHGAYGSEQIFGHQKKWQLNYRANYCQLCREQVVDYILDRRSQCWSKYLFFYVTIWPWWRYNFCTWWI
jgi:hypothetical protein